VLNTPLHVPSGRVFRFIDPSSQYWLRVVRRELARTNSEDGLARKIICGLDFVEVMAVTLRVTIRLDQTQ
jgi:hypothetical protein